MESEVSLDNKASEFLKDFGYGMDAFDFINFIIGESSDGIHRIFFAENFKGHTFNYSKMAGMVSSKTSPEKLYKALHNIFDPEIHTGEYGLLTVQSMPFYDVQNSDESEQNPYDVRVYLISYHSIAMYGADDAEEFMITVLNDPHASYSDAWIYKGLQDGEPRLVDFT